VSILWSVPKRTTKQVFYYTLARDVRKQTERKVNVQRPYGAMRQPVFIDGSQRLSAIPTTRKPYHRSTGIAPQEKLPPVPIDHMIHVPLSCDSESASRSMKVCNRVPKVDETWCTDILLQRPGSSADSVI
jgi:hypothetical protein